MDDGNSVIVCYLESGYVYVLRSFCITLILIIAVSVTYLVEPWDIKWQKKVNGRI